MTMTNIQMEKEIHGMITSKGRIEDVDQESGYVKIYCEENDKTHFVHQREIFNIVPGVDQVTAGQEVEVYCSKIGRVVSVKLVFAKASGKAFDYSTGYPL